MVRKRLVKELVLKSWDDVDNNLKAIMVDETQVEKLEGEMNRKIADIKARYKEKIDPIKKEIKENEKNIREFVEENKDNMNGKKSRVLTHGQVGFRKSTKVDTPKKMIPSIIEKLKRRKMDNCINTKETINKEELKKYPADIVIEVGASIVVDDTFFYEPDRDSIPD
jgi:phage host-nuclease inhibitor protein Gam